MMISMRVSTEHESNFAVDLNESRDMLTLTTTTNLGTSMGPFPYEMVTLHVHGSTEELSLLAQKIQAAVAPAPDPVQVEV